MKNFIKPLLASALALSLMASAQAADIDVSKLPHRSDDANAPVVYMTTQISPEAMLKIYETLGRTPTGNVAVKLSTGEAGNPHYLQPSLIKGVVDTVKGTIVECNTAYGGSRAETAMHMQVAKDHGFTEIAKVDIMDAEGSMEIPVEGGKFLKKNLVGTHLPNYDFMVGLTHFKGHAMGGFGGALKNISIGVASANGKGQIHTAGQSTEVDAWMRLGGFASLNNPDHDAFIQSMAEAAKSVYDYYDHGNKMLFITVMNNMSVDCDCDGNPAKPDMHDIGILASFDPVALDQACIDLVYAAPDSKNLIERIESRNGLLIFDHAQEIGFGNRNYQLKSID